MSAYSTTGVWFGSAKWCQAPDSHREAVRFELTRYANSRQLGGTRGQTRTDNWRLRKSPPFPLARVWRPELDSNQHRRLRRPSTGSIDRGELERANGVEPSRASLATMPRTMRARAFGSCRRICTCYLRLIRSVLICMSFAAVDWSEWLDCSAHPWPRPFGPGALRRPKSLHAILSNQRSRAPGARALVQTEPHSESGQGGRTCTCGFRVPGSAVCC